MKNKNITILFTDNSVTSKNFACHFLHYNLLSLKPLEITQDNTTTSTQIFKPKHAKEVSIVVCFDNTPTKTVQDLNLNANTTVLTNNLASYVALKQLNINCCFVVLPQNLTQEKLTLKCNKQVHDLPNTITLKTDNALVSTTLSQHIFNSSVGAVCLTKNKTPKQLALSIKSKNQILKLIREQILLTNSIMLTVEKYNQLNFYKLLSGKGFLNKIKQHFSLLGFLFSLKTKFQLSDVANSLNTLCQLNFKNYVEIQKTNNMLQKINNIKQTNMAG